ncbi:hypothetical protein M3Y99_00168600 [Aphelenchoides fujianensis]|nr:hypothetical protein M3Y99_00168600 [Aphelenchoides fujianensis]
MQLKQGALDDLLSEDEDLRPLEKPLSPFSSTDSLNGLDHDAYASDAQSEDLDKLSLCLSEASSESNDGKRPSLFSELIQAQLALWTLIGSILYSYAWQQHRKKFLLSLFVVIPPVVIIVCTMSSLLTAIVIMSRIFSTSLCFEEILKGNDSRDSVDGGFQQRYRTTSMNSTASLMSGRSSSCEKLPEPMCRKHSTSNGSLHQISHRSISPNSIDNGSGIRSPSHRLSYAFAHSSGGNDFH